MTLVTNEDCMKMMWDVEAGDQYPPSDNAGRFRLRVDNVTGLAILASPGLMGVIVMRRDAAGCVTMDT